MCEMRVWCRDTSTEEVFCDRVVVSSRLFPKVEDVAEMIRRMYAAEAPQVEIIKIVELMLIEREFH